LVLAAVVAAAGIAVAVATRAPVARGGHTLALASLERGVFDDINAFRAAHHLPTLRLSAALTDAARSHSVQMEADGYFAHDSADGTAFWKRIQAFYPSAAFAYWSVGENLLWSSPTVNASHALSMWIASPEHLRNLLDPNWREIGVSAVHTAAAPGVYRGMAVTIITTDFGARH
jgi:uncharacterized protein YkwD